MSIYKLVIMWHMYQLRVMIINDVSYALQKTIEEVKISEY